MRRLVVIAIAWRGGAKKQGKLSNHALDLISIIAKIHETKDYLFDVFFGTLRHLSSF